MRGLKQINDDGRAAIATSHLIRVRGLKQEINVLVVDGYVAPYTGAWIETISSADGHAIVQVAPYTGAWIETAGMVHKPFSKSSHLIRVRGLKPAIGQHVQNSLKSHLIRVRGLKHQ